MQIGDFCIQTGELAKKVNNGIKYNATTAAAHFSTSGGSDGWTIGGEYLHGLVLITSLNQLMDKIKDEIKNYTHSKRKFNYSFYAEALEWFANRP